VSTEDPPCDTPVDLHRTAFVGATCALGLAGAVVATYGTILVGVAHHFSLPIATAGLVLSSNFAGAVIGVLLAWKALRRQPGARVLAVALLLFAAGLLAAALAPDWPTFIAAIFVGGVGFGAVDFQVVSLVARTEVRARAARLSVSGAGWGLGAIAGPLVIILLRPQNFQIFLAFAAVAGLFLIPMTRSIRAPVPSRGDAAGSVDRPHQSILPVFVVALGSYVALETAAAGWLATQLHGWGYDAPVPAAVTAGFWAGLALGRLAGGRLSSRWRSQRLITVGLAIAIVLLVGAGIRVLAPVIYPLVGFAVALVFPLGLHWFTQLRPEDLNGLGLLLLVDMVGGVVGSGAANLCVAVFGLGAVPFVAAAFGALCLSAFLRARRFPVHVNFGSATP
jgi:MFS transporter, FHS family, glucose/mannose:H+ symporter